MNCSRTRITDKNNRLTHTLAYNAKDISVTQHSPSLPDAAQDASARLDRILDRFPSLRVLVIGDMMLDRFIWGQVKRISPEAPVPIVRVTRESLHAGGAGNVVTNIRALGGQVIVCGVIGQDHHGRRLVQELVASGAEVNGVLISRRMSTISKTRIIAHNQQVVRLDREPTEAFNSRIRARLRAFVRKHIAECHVHVVVVSDYGKGTIDGELLALLAELRGQHGFIYMVDPKYPNFPHYRGASLVKPNMSEAEQATGLVIRNAATLHQAGSRLLELWQAEAVLISRGEDGLSLFKTDGSVSHFPTIAREVFDVTGAGDTVQAACALALGAGAPLETATILANHAASVVVGKVGTATVSPAELKTILQETHTCEV